MNNTTKDPQVPSNSLPSSRKRWVLWGGILGLLALGGGSVLFIHFLPNEILGDLNETDPMQTTEELSFEDLYEAGPMQATKELFLDNKDVLNLNKLRNLPDDGNVLKLHTACTDSTTGISYVAGIMSQDIGVIEGGELTKYFHTEFDGSSLKSLYCDNGYLIIADENLLITLDPETGEQLAQVSSQSYFFPQIGFLDGEEGLFILPEPEGKKITIYDASNLKALHSVPTGEYRTKWFKGEDGNLLALEEDRDRKEIHASWYDPDTFAELKTADLDVSFSVSMDYDPQTDSIWIAMKDKLLQFSISSGRVETTLLVPEDITEVLVEGDRILVLSENSYDDNKEPGYKGGLLIVDANTGEMIQELQIPWKHSEIDAHDNLAIVTNNDGNSVSLVDLETGNYEVVFVGSATESLAVNDEGTLYVANRLGGSTIVTADAEEIDSPGWPVGLAYSSSLNQILAYNMLGSSIDVIDANSNEVIKTYDLGIEDANSDALGSSAFDATHQVLFAGVPELSTVVAVNIENGEILKTIVLPEGQTAKENLGGPGDVLIGVYEPSMTVYVYNALSEELLRYDGLNDFGLLSSETVSVKDLSTYPMGLFVDQYHGRVFLGSSVFDAETGKLIGSLPEGPQSVLGIDNEHGVIFAVGLKGEEEILYALHADLSSIVEQKSLSEGRTVRSTGIYDANTGKLYISQMVLGEVWIFDVFDSN